MERSTHHICKDFYSENFYDVSFVKTYFLFYSVVTTKALEDRISDNFIFLELALHLPAIRPPVATPIVLSSFPNLSPRPLFDWQFKLGSCSDYILSTMGEDQLHQLRIEARDSVLSPIPHHDSIRYHPCPWFWYHIKSCSNACSFPIPHHTI